MGLTEWVSIGSVMLCTGAFCASIWQERRARRLLLHTQRNARALEMVARQRLAEYRQTATRDLLWSLLNPDQRDEYSLHGSVTIPSTLHPKRTYHLSNHDVTVRQQGMEVGHLCAQLAEPGLDLLPTDWTMATLLHLQGAGQQELRERAEPLHGFTDGSLNQ